MKEIKFAPFFKLLINILAFFRGVGDRECEGVFGHLNRQLVTAQLESFTAKVKKNEQLTKLLNTFHNF